MNGELAYGLLQKILSLGICEFCICPGKRNAPLVTLLAQNPHVRCYYWFEERSAAFFALGRSRATSKPVAVVTTSGTAAAELLPATMEAHYLGVPLLLITADRPRRFRKTGAPQTAEQVGLFGCYVDYEEDLALGELSHLEAWQQQGPAHVNACFEEPLKLSHRYPTLILNEAVSKALRFDVSKYEGATQSLHDFIKDVAHPLVVVSSLQPSDREAVAQFLLQLKAPIYLEATSGLQQDPRLDSLRIARSEQIWQAAERSGYALDGILRIGGVPTVRLWRDLEDLEGKIKVCSITRVPFSGLFWGQCLTVPLSEFLVNFSLERDFDNRESNAFLENDRSYRRQLEQLFVDEPQAEASLVYRLMDGIDSHSMVYLGNSLPIREWDLAAIGPEKNYEVCASRGVNGIDGQISAFLGLCQPGRKNWALIGDLTALYDMAGPWILPQLGTLDVIVVVVNNSGGQIFSRMFSEKEFLHEHQLSFEPLARMWQMTYSCWSSIPNSFQTQGAHLIEIVPDSEASNRFWQKLGGVK